MNDQTTLDEIARCGVPALRVVARELRETVAVVRTLTDAVCADAAKIAALQSADSLRPTVSAAEAILQEKVHELEAEASRLRPYVRHSANCSISIGMQMAGTGASPPCTCGLEDAKKGATP